MLGAICGDVIGSVYEFQSTKDPGFPLFPRRSIFTDDSVLTAAVADYLLTSLAPADDDTRVSGYGRYLRSWGRAYPDAGYGGRFIEWLGGNEGPYYSWGNGSAMRVSPVGWFFDTEEQVLREAELSALPTHNHPEGIKGAQAAALAVFLARQGESKDAIRKSLERRFGYSLSRTIAAIRPGYRFDVSCAGSVPEALIAFLESSDFESAVRNAVSLGGDADTQAAIAGAAAEAFYGGVPRGILDFVLPRLTPDILEVTRRFAEHCLPEEELRALRAEEASRRRS